MLCIILVDIYMNNELPGNSVIPVFSRSSKLSKHIYMYFVYLRLTLNVKIPEALVCIRLGALKSGGRYPVSI
jgi:hypothetical protein